MNVGKTLLKGAGYIGAIVGGIWAVDHAAKNAAESLKEVQNRRKEYANSVQKHYETCFARGQTMLVDAGFDNLSLRIAAFLPLPSSDEVCIQYMYMLFSSSPHVHLMFLFVLQ